MTGGQPCGAAGEATHGAGASPGAGAKRGAAGGGAPASARRAPALVTPALAGSALAAPLHATVAFLAAQLGAPARGSAQRRLVYDTLSDPTPGAVTCGVCAGKQAGSVFDALDASDGGLGVGLRPEEFPVILRGLEVAVAAGTVEGIGACVAGTEGGTGLFDLSVHAGEVVPWDVRALPERGPWPGEAVVLELDEVPLELSTRDSPTAPRVSVRVHRLDLGADAVRVEPPATYLRFVLTLRADAAGISSVCEAGRAPIGFPMRDDDGRVGPRRGLVYARSPMPGWFWAEEVGVRGDWALRLVITRLGGGGGGGGGGGCGGGGCGGGGGGDGGIRDAGAGDAAVDDASADDAGAEPVDGATRADAGDPPTPPGGACACRATRAPVSAVRALQAAPWLALAARGLAVPVARARRAARRRAWRAAVGAAGERGAPRPSAAASPAAGAPVRRGGAG